MEVGILYKEEQFLPTWIYLLFFLWIPVILIIFALYPESLMDNEFVMIIFGVIFFEFVSLGLVGKMTIFVKWNELIVNLGFLGLRILAIKKSQIESVKIAEEKLWKKYGGWGIRTGFGVVAYVYFGGGGVEIDLKEKEESFLRKFLKPKKIVISSKNPYRFFEAITSMS